MEKTRHFIVDTPVGQLAIYAKHDKTDCAADYPGVFIDYVRKDGATAILACVEYDPNKEALQTVVYGNCASDGRLGEFFHSLINECLSFRLDKAPCKETLAWNG